MTIAITDHALLRWLERVHGVDVEAFRGLMRAEVEVALEAFDGREARGEAAFILCDQTVVTTLADGHRPIKRPECRDGVAVPRVAA